MYTSWNVRSRLSWLVRGQRGNNCNHEEAQRLHNRVIRRIPSRIGELELTIQRLHGSTCENQVQEFLVQSFGQPMIFQDHN